MAENARWRLRGTLIIVGILTLVICTMLLIYYTCLLFHDLRDLKLGQPIWQEAGSKGQLMTSLLKAIDMGLEDVCDFQVMTQAPNATDPNNNKTKREMKMEMKREIHKGIAGRVRTAARYHPKEDKRTNGVPTSQRSTRSVTGNKLRIKRMLYSDVTLQTVNYYARSIVRNPKQSIPANFQKTQPPKPPKQTTKKKGSEGKENVTDEYAPTEPSNYTYPPLPVHADQDLCMIVVEEERQKLKDDLYGDRNNVYSRLEKHIHNIFIALDIIVMILCALGIIVGYILIVGALRKRHQLILPWLLITFTVAYGAMVYMICHYYMENRPKPDNHFGVPLSDLRSVHGSWDPTTIAIIALLTLIVIGLHAAGFYAATKYYYHLREKRDSRPDAPIRRMRLVLSRRVD